MIGFWPLTLVARGLSLNMIIHKKETFEDNELLTKVPMNKLAKKLGVNPSYLSRVKNNLDEVSYEQYLSFKDAVNSLLTK